MKGVLLVDEMVIKTGIQYDTSTTSTIGHPTMKNTSGTYDKIATHALVFIITGISTAGNRL